MFGFLEDSLECGNSSYVALDTGDFRMLRRFVCHRFFRVHLVAGIAAEMVAVRVFPCRNTCRSDKQESNKSNGAEDKEAPQPCTE